MDVTSCILFFLYQIHMLNYLLKINLETKIKIKINHFTAGLKSYGSYIFNRTKILIFFYFLPMQWVLVQYTLASVLHMLFELDVHKVKCAFGGFKNILPGIKILNLPIFWNVSKYVIVILFKFRELLFTFWTEH